MEPGQNTPTQNNSGNDPFGQQGTPGVGPASSSADASSPSVHPWTPPSETSPSSNANGGSTAGASSTGQAPFSAPFGGDANGSTTPQTGMPMQPSPFASPASNQDMMGSMPSNDMNAAGSTGQPQPNPAGVMSPTPMPNGDAMQSAQAPMSSQPAAAPKSKMASRGNFILLVIVAVVLVAAAAYLMLRKS